MAQSDSLRVDISQWLLVTLAGLVLAFRYFLRLTRTKRALVDDHVLVFAWMCMLISVSLRTTALDKSGDLPMPLVDPAIRPEIGKLNAIAGPFNIGGSMLSKTSFALTLLNVVIGRPRYVLWFIIASMNIALLLSILFLVVSCKPVAKGWDPTLPGTCWPQYIQVRFGLFASAYSAFMDVVLAGLAWWVIWGITMRMREKIGVAVGMSMGIFAGITGAIKCVYLSKLDFLNLYIWEAAEISVTIMAASIPILRVFVMEKARDYSSGRTGGESDNTTVYSSKFQRRSFDRIGADGDKFGCHSDMQAGAKYRPTGSGNRYSGQGVAIHTTTTYGSSGQGGKRGSTSQPTSFYEAYDTEVEMASMKRSDSSEPVVG